MLAFSISPVVYGWGNATLISLVTARTEQSPVRAVEHLF